MDLEIRIKWLKGDARGTVDVLPVNIFRRQATHFVQSHVVEFAKGREYFARFSANIRSQSASLNYALHERFNIKRGMTLGRFDLEFTDEARTKLAAVAWDGTKLGSDYVSFGTVTVGKAPYRLRPTKGLSNNNMLTSLGRGECNNSILRERCRG